MLELVLIIAGVVAFLFLFFKLMLWYATTLAKVMVEKRHRDADFVLTTGRVPPQWVGRGGNTATRADRLRARALRNLTSLIRYMNKTTLVDTEETRQTMLERLDRIRAHWKHAEWPEIRPEV